MICKGVHAVIAVTRINSKGMGHSGSTYAQTFDYVQRALEL